LFKSVYDIDIDPSVGGIDPFHFAADTVTQVHIFQTGGNDANIL